MDFPESMLNMPTLRNIASTLETIEWNTHCIHLPIVIFMRTGDSRKSKMRLVKVVKYCTLRERTEVVAVRGGANL